MFPKYFLAFVLLHLHSQDSCDVRSLPLLAIATMLAQDKKESDEVAPHSPPLVVHHRVKLTTVLVLRLNVTAGSAVQS